MSNAEKWLLHTKSGHLKKKKMVVSHGVRYFWKMVFARLLKLDIFEKISGILTETLWQAWIRPTPSLGSRRLNICYCIELYEAEVALGTGQACAAFERRGDVPAGSGSFRPQTVSSHGRFAPKTFPPSRPPPSRFAPTGCFAPKSFRRHIL